MLASLQSRVNSLAGIARDVQRLARRSDVMVVAAALTCYATFGLVPLLAIGVRVAGGVFGAERSTQVAAQLAAFVPGPLQLGRQLTVFTAQAAAAPWWTVLVALLPVSLYAEGIVRSLERFSRVRERRSRAIRGRVLTPVLVVFVVVVVLAAVGPVRPVLHGFGTGTGPRLLGVLVAFNLLFFPMFGLLMVVYRLFASTPLRRGPRAWGAFTAASWLCGQFLGYLLAVRMVGGFAHAFGGYAPAAVVAALAFLVYLEQLVFVLGYLVALVLHERVSTRPAAPGTPRPDGPRPEGPRPDGPGQPSSTTNGRWSETPTSGVSTDTTRRS